MIKAVVVDMDGTFLTSENDYDRERFKKIYQILSNKQIRFVVASGNQFAQLKSFFPGMEENIAFISENGALVFENNLLIKESHFELDLVQQVMSYLKDHHIDANFVLCGVHKAYIEAAASEEFKSFAATYYYALKEVDRIEELEEDKYVKFALSVPVEKTTSIQEALQHSFGKKIVAVSSGHGSIDIIIPDKHKAFGLSYLADKWGISPKDILAFGDGNNDAEMLQYVGHSYAMANGSELVKKVAKHSAPSNDESGVLQVIEKYL
ncbi:HAD family hydrolase [Desemzia sp. RIT804]|uniref:Cof-type HAD-IIB family hydrolase n=1 Tax=Desemzia sp. RIT 804 TaxID=2810209 RepID=UPI00194E2FE1|nr:Cof-type HAD-IIB family hydrolase [Desemzia sp. RIT 804]MBM6613525.1 HAD family hydrolase [Desemzia sp. RIT 804]